MAAPKNTKKARRKKATYGGPRPGSGRPAADPRRPLTSRLAAKISAAEMAAAQRAAAEQGLTLSAWVRAAVLAALGR